MDTTGCPRPPYTWWEKQERIIHLYIKNVAKEPNWCKPTRSIISHMVLSLHPIKEVINYCLHSGEPYVVRTRQHPSIHSEWKKTSQRMEPCSNKNWVRRLPREGNNATFVRILLHYFCVRQVESCDWVGAVARRSSLAVELLALCLSSNNNKTTTTTTKQQGCRLNPPRTLVRKSPVNFMISNLSKQSGFTEHRISEVWTTE